MQEELEKVPSAFATLVANVNAERAAEAALSYTKRVQNTLRISTWFYLSDSAFATAFSASISP
jgi:hypothetical protein